MRILVSVHLYSQIPCLNSILISTGSAQCFPCHFFYLGDEHGMELIENTSLKVPCSLSYAHSPLGLIELYSYLREYREALIRGAMRRGQYFHYVPWVA